MRCGRAGARVPHVSRACRPLTCTAARCHRRAPASLPLPRAPLARLLRPRPQQTTVAQARLWGGEGHRAAAASGALWGSKRRGGRPPSQGIGILAARSSGRAAGGAPGYPRVPAHVPHGLSQHKTVRGRDGRPLDPRGRGQGLRSSRPAARSQGPGREETRCHAPTAGSGDTSAPSRSESRSAHGSSLSIRDKSSGLDRAQSVREQDRHQRQEATASRGRTRSPSVQSQAQPRQTSAPTGGSVSAGARGVTDTDGARRQRCEGGGSGQHPLAHPSLLHGVGNPGCRIPRSPRNSLERGQHPGAQEEMRAAQAPLPAAPQPASLPVPAPNPPGSAAPLPASPSAWCGEGERPTRPAATRGTAPGPPPRAGGTPAPRLRPQRFVLRRRGLRSQGVPRQGWGGLAGNSSPPCSII